MPAVSRGSAPAAAPDVGSRGAPGLEPTGRTVTQPSATTADVVGTSGQPAPNPQSDAAVTMMVPTPPPAAPAEPAAPSATPGDNRVWVPSHYTYTGGQWTLVSGSYQRPPSEGSVWVPGHYDVSTQRWTAPHWAPGGAGGQRQTPAR